MKVLVILHSIGVLTHEFFKPTIFENITIFLILCFSFPFTQNFREIKWQLHHRIQKTVIFSKVKEFKSS